VLQVDPSDGKARVINDSTFNNIRFDGYQIASASGSLMSTWNSLQDQAVAGWEETSTTTGLLAELNPTTNTTVNAGQTAATMTGLFRTAGGVQDLTFQFRVPGAGPGTGVLNGIVRYLPFSSGLIGDYNGNGVVDAADYVVWRNSVGQTVALPNRHPDNVGPIGLQEYLDWRARFGNAISGSGALSASPVPEPSASALLVLATIGLGLTCRRVKFFA
jgi:hypothetical protein